MGTEKTCHSSILNHSGRYCQESVLKKFRGWHWQASCSSIATFQSFTSSVLEVEVSSHRTAIDHFHKSNCLPCFQQQSWRKFVKIIDPTSLLLLLSLQHFYWDDKVNCWFQL